MRKFGIIILILFVLGLVPNSIIFASITDGTIDATYKYAWSENAGWMNFGCDNCNVHITDSGLTGYIWNENYGWINLSPSISGVKNDGEGNLSGYAWGENLGWIDFDNVSINTSGKFTGTASGTISGVVNFDCANCGVQTDWRPRSTRGGGLPPQACNSPVAPEGGFKILINNDAKYTHSQIVILDLFGGPNTERMAISNFSDFRDAGQELYTGSKTWDLCKGRISCPEGKYTVYAKFYAPWGTSSEVVFDSIIYRKEKPIIRIPEIFKKIPEKVSEVFKPKSPRAKPSEIPVEKVVPKAKPSEIPVEKVVPKERPLLANFLTRSFEILHSVTRNITDLFSQFKVKLKGIFSFSFVNKFLRFIKNFLIFK